jgi:hypothetical protein
MVVTKTTSAGIFDSRLYVDMNMQAARYVGEDTQINWVPAKQTSKLNAYQYKKPIFGASIGVTGAHHIGLAEDRMETPKNHNVYDLEAVQADIMYDMNDMTMDAEFLAQAKSQELWTWADQVKQSYFKGVFEKGFNAGGKGQGFRLNNGFIEQATLVENLDGVNSQLTAAGDVYLALDKIVNSIPFRLRDGKRVIIGCDDLFQRMARKALFRGATNQMSEFDMFFKELAETNPQGTDPKVGKPLIVSDKLFLNQLAGTVFTETDTLGTHSRLFAAVADPEVIEAVYSFYGMMGEKVEPTIRGVSQKWVGRLGGCVHQIEGVCYSEQITWA